MASILRNLPSISELVGQVGASAGDDGGEEVAKALCASNPRGLLQVQLLRWDCDGDTPTASCTADGAIAGDGVGAQRSDGSRRGEG
eukprot:2153865-Pleurochrysis_carterae.AAC.1